MGKMEEIDARLAAKMAEIDGKLGKLGLGKSSAAGGSEMQNAEGAMHNADGGAGQSMGEGASSSAALLGRIRSILPDQRAGDIGNPALWETTPAELNQIMGYVKNSPHVVSNALYSQIGPKLSFKLVDDPTINAFATIENGTPAIYLLNGAVRYANIVAASYALTHLNPQASNKTRALLPELIGEFASFIRSCQYSLTAEKAVEFGATGPGMAMLDPVLSRKATSCAAGLLIGILAHEYGHLALGHLYGASQTLEISRNQEREADSFASSVISSSPFGDYAVVGFILWELVWVWQEKENPGGIVASTHPLASERLADLIRANPSSAAAFGLKI